MDEAIALAEAKAARLTLTRMRAAATGQQPGPRLATPRRAKTIPREGGNPVDDLDGDPIDGEPTRIEGGETDSEEELEETQQVKSQIDVDTLQLLNGSLIPSEEDDNTSWRPEAIQRREEGKGKRRASSSARSPSPIFDSGDKSQLHFEDGNSPIQPNDRVEYLFAKGRRAEAMALLDQWDRCENPRANSIA
ncbi:uncharacterized protein MELLADRAFT_101380 [Melampsora larici-populina 98AG31]|uniref:Uncharacterized protein n=1 Tax=Melampsora larici-populina (strain 98AG31 / pathotype 3-4-7) TaxID=747676 RepID=F4R4J8_MELLP|nr:uncharacterized protein MELLADRAFT_101380 [Melampsora larici-populina 98AG31]EGG12823.1 hypothetical protein MELLADRAFT_101380 [Melampsora larici-populina 98AG31]